MKINILPISPYSLHNHVEMFTCMGKTKEKFAGTRARKWWKNAPDHIKAHFTHDELNQYHRSRNRALEIDSASKAVGSRNFLDDTYIKQTSSSFDVLLMLPEPSAAISEQDILYPLLNAMVMLKNTMDSKNTTEVPEFNLEILYKMYGAERTDSAIAKFNKLKAAFFTDKSALSGVSESKAHDTETPPLSLNACLQGAFMDRFNKIKAAIGHYARYYPSSSNGTALNDLVEHIENFDDFRSHRTDIKLVSSTISTKAYKTAFQSGFMRNHSASTSLLLSQQLKECTEQFITMVSSMEKSAVYSGANVLREVHEPGNAHANDGAIPTY